MDALGDASLPPPKAGTVTIFLPEPKVAKRDFKTLQADAAWFSSQAKDGHRGQALLAVRIDQDRVYATKGGGHQVLRRGGVLMRRSDKRIVAVQPEAFLALYVRCFSDGTEICRLSDTPMHQAVALSQSNSQIRNRIEQAPRPTFLQNFRRLFTTTASAAEQVQQWNLQIRAHIQDLSGRYKVVKVVKVMTA